MQARFPSADSLFGVGGGFKQQLFAYLLLGYRLALHEFVQFQQVFLRVEGDALSFAAVATGASGGRPSPISRRNFDRRFREAMGHSALEEILSVRLAAVCELLLRTNTPVMTIADFCGFGTHSALDTLFRQRFNMSMGAWREKNKY